MSNLLLRALILLPLFGAGCLPPITPQPLYGELPKPQVTVTRTSLVLNQKIFFEFDQDRILPISYPILEELSRILRERPEIRKVRIEGHTDNVGTLTYNLNLSNRRAQAVQKFVEKRGVPTDRLSSAGFGQSQPVADNETEDGRAQNRRVSFVIERWANQPEVRHAQR